MAGCSSVASTDDTSFKVTTDLAEVEVTGKAGEKPSLDVKEPFSATDTSRRMLTTGKGKPLTAGQRITIDVR